MRLTKHQLKLIPRIQRKYNVSINFLKSNLPNIEKFLWYALSPRLIIKRIAVRKRNKQRVILNYYHLKRVLFDQAERKVIKIRRRNVQQWSRQMVSYLRRKHGVEEHIEITSVSDNLDQKDKVEEKTHTVDTLAPEEVSKQLKEQLELLRSRSRIVPFIATETNSTKTGYIKIHSNAEMIGLIDSIRETPATSISNNGENTVEMMTDKRVLGSVENRLEQSKYISKADKNIYSHDSNKHSADSKNIYRSDILESNESSSASKSVTGSSRNFLDMLMDKVGGKTILPEISGKSSKVRTLSDRKIVTEKCMEKNNDNEHFTDSGEEFLGFDETERLPGMMLTPLVPFSAQSKGNSNGAFVSESLNEFMRKNSLENNKYVANENETTTERRHRQATLDGLVTPDCVPPRIEMPIVPESLQKLRTVAERRQYLQKFNRNHKLAIINNEAAIYRELQRKMRHHKSKSVSQQILQAPNSQMPFTRQGWQAASFVTTEFNHYYYQTLKVTDGQQQEFVRLPGVRGNNEERNKQPYQSRVPYNVLKSNCNAKTCGDALIWRDLKPLKTEPDKKKLNESPLPPVFKPCPLSHKPFQKPLDEESAPVLLAGGSMAVVRMPIVELEVFPAVGKPLHEVAKRYLEHILPHRDITREWAEFSLSTLQERVYYSKKYNSLKQSNDKINVSCGKNESYSFHIPYVNDRSHILVRRVVDRSERLDQTFEMAETPWENFSFRNGINQSDIVLTECADMICEMINSVAISCSENSFIKVDPDGIQSEGVVGESKHEKAEKNCINKVAAEDSKIASQTVMNKKQNRLLLELRRLNATIIDAATKAETGTKPCSKEYCAFGCVCQSLIDDYPLRQHCGKSKCVIECTCKGTNQSHIMRLETDGRSITTEDAFMLRRQATARLARMEKEFTSTIVLTENETLLINESQYDKKRRCTKAPKRYEDIGDNDDDYTGRSAANASPMKSQNTAVVAIETTTDTSANSGFSETTTELREPIYVKDKVFMKLKHCTVPLIPFEDTQNMAVWCMMHELYKCHCGGRATEGKPLVIEKDYGETIPNDKANLKNVKTVSVERKSVISLTKPRYSFEQVEWEVDKEDEAVQSDNKKSEENYKENHTYNKKRKSLIGFVKYANAADEQNGSDDEGGLLQDSTDSEYDGGFSRSKRSKIITKRKERRGGESEIIFINKYLNNNPDSCRRAVAVPRKSYQFLNRARRTKVNDFKAKHENKQTMLLLNEHILRSVYYHKNEMEKLGKLATQETALLRNKRKLIAGESSESDVPKKESFQGDVEPLQKKPLGDQQIQVYDDGQCHSIPASLSSSSGKMKPEKRSRSCHQTINTLTGQNSEYNSLPEIDGNMPIAEVSILEGEMKLSEMQNPENGIHGDGTKTPISVATTFGAMGDISSGGSECSAAISQNMEPTSPLSRTRMDFFKDVVRSMNSLVNKKMQDIGLALKRESKVIPAPNNEILCIIKWSNFLDAFTEGFVFIWKVKLRDDHTFYAATISNVMPMVLNAVGVVNIEGLNISELPLLGKMLMQRLRNHSTCDLAIVMQGRPKYWLIKGFLRADKSSACAKPTPKSHPLLTRKINILSSLLAKQHLRELNKKATQACKELSSDPTMADYEGILVPTQNDNSTQQSALKQKLPSAFINIPKIISVNNSINNTSTSIEKNQLKCTQSSAMPNSITSSSYKSKSNVRPSLLQELVSSNNKFCEMKTNIMFRKVTKTDIEELHGLDVTTEPHRWLVLDLCKDFSHVYVPDFQELVSLDRIKKVMVFSRQKQKIVKLQFFKNAAYDAFVTPVSARKIYFGPLKLNLPPPSLILLQNVDGKMMLRETYQQSHNIQGKTGERTTAFWMIRKNGQVHFDFDMVESRTNSRHNHETLVSKGLSVKSSADGANPIASDDEDCMIVENDETAMPFSLLVSQSEPNIAVKSFSNINSQTNHSEISAQRTTYTIQTNLRTNHLQITSLGSEPSTNLKTATTDEMASQIRMLPKPVANDLLPRTQMPFIPLNAPSVPLSTTQSLQESIPVTGKESSSILCDIPSNAVIASVAAAPAEAPYGSTIYISGLPITIPSDSSHEQLANNQLIPQSNQYISPASIFPYTLNSMNSPANSNYVCGTPTANFLTPPKVTANTDTDLGCTAASTKVREPYDYFLQTAERQSDILENSTSSGTLSQPSNSERTQSQSNEKSSEKLKDWRRFLMDEKSETSTIGSTTITKMVEDFKYDVNNSLAVDKLSTSINLDEDEFEPAASIVFKSHTSPPRALNISNGLNNNSGSSNTLNTSISMSTIADSMAATDKSVSKSQVRPSISTIPKSDNKPTKAQVTTLPLRKLQPKDDPNNLRQISTGANASKSISVPYLSSVSKKMKRKVTMSNEKASVRPTSWATETKMNILNQTLDQELEIQSQPLGSTTTSTIKAYGSHLSLPTTTTSFTTATTSLSSAIKSTFDGSTPNPLINVRPAVPIQERFRIGNPSTKLYSGSVLSTSTINKNLSHSTAVTTVSLAPRPKVTATSRTSATVNNVAFKVDTKKYGKNVYEQYGVFCSSTNDNLPKFWAKRVQNSYIVKVPGISSVLQRPDLESVGVYLNNHLLSQSPAMKSKLPIKWKFVSSEQLNLPTKMPATNQDVSNSQKYAAHHFKMPEIDPSGKNKLWVSTESNFLRGVGNGAITMKDKKCSETILIED